MPVEFKEAGRRVDGQKGFPGAKNLQKPSGPISFNTEDKKPLLVQEK